MDEIKSVRVRRNDINSGTLDIRVVIFKQNRTFGPDERVVAGIYNPYKPDARKVWIETTYKKSGVYKDYTDDQFIKDFIDMNSKMEGKSYYIIQDPWENKVPIYRNYGSDPYYLNNGAVVYIMWKDGDTAVGGQKYSDDSGHELTPKDISFKKTIKINSSNETQGFTLGKNGDFEYSSNSREYASYIKDRDIISEIISKWKIKVDNYDLGICLPINESCSIIPYKGPLQPIVPDVPATPVGATAINAETSSSKEKINIVLQTEKIKVKEDVTSLKVYIGIAKETLLEEKSLNDEQDDFIDGEGVDYSEYIEEGFAGSEEKPFDLMEDSEILRDDNPSSPPPPDGGGSSTGGSQVNSPGGSVSKTEVALPADLSKVRNSSIIKTQSMGGSSRGINNDIRSPKGDVVLGSDIAKSMNEFVLDVLGPFATFLKTKYPSLYSSWYITSATRGYVPPGGSLTSQHMKGEAIDSQILGANANNPGKNIELLNAILEWYKTNKVGYGQILFETRGNSCWIHWSYKRGNTRLQLLRFAQDSTLRSASANTTGKYVLPPVTASQLGFSNYA